MALFLTINFASWLSALLPLILASRTWKSNPHVVRLVMLIAACSFLFDLLGYVLGMNKLSTYPAGNAYLLVQALIFLVIYREALKIKNPLFYAITGIYSLFFVTNYFYLQGPFIINSYSVVVGSVGFILLSLLYFRQLLNNLPEPFVHRIPMVWVNVAVLIYFGGNLFLFMLFNYFVSAIWILHNMLNITKNILLFVAVWQSQRKMNSSSS
ncbi:MAG: hypothetical protein JNL40_09730 [Cyclobacteriaceae bacterium]|nr:hypothetical protein [Cyclobacteriaceae bacterium]